MNTWTGRFFSEMFILLKVIENTVCEKNFNPIAHVTLAFLLFDYPVLFTMVT